jgi:hypothetical protein
MSTWLRRENVLAKTRAKVTKAAKRDVRGAKTLAGEAVSAAAMAAAGVVLQGVAKALGGGKQKDQEAGQESSKKTPNRRAPQNSEIPRQRRKERLSGRKPLKGPTFAPASPRPSSQAARKRKT